MQTAWAGCNFCGDQAWSINVDQNNNKEDSFQLCNTHKSQQTNKISLTAVHFV